MSANERERKTNEKEPETATTFFFPFDALRSAEKPKKKEEKLFTMASSLPRRRRATRDHAKVESVVEITCPPERHVSTPFWELVEHAKGVFEIGDAGWLEMEGRRCTLGQRFFLFFFSVIRFSPSFRVSFSVDSSEILPLVTCF